MVLVLARSEEDNPYQQQRHALPLLKSQRADMQMVELLALPNMPDT